MRASQVLLLFLAVCSTVRGQTCASELERLAPSASLKDCILSPGDALYIWTPGQCTWNLPVIAEDGKLTLPWIGQVQAAGLTRSELDTNIKGLLFKYLIAPHVTVTVADNVNQQRYFVDGVILRPGRYSLKEPTTILDAVQKAAGSDQPAHVNKIVVVRGDLNRRLKYKHLTKHPEENMLVENGDHIVIIP